MNLPANSTFLPVLDDLLSPDFRPLNYPAQTPQTPTDVVSFGGGKIITNAYGNITGYNNASAVGRASATTNTTTTDSRNFMAASLREETGSFDNDNDDDDGETSDVEAAASKIQNWWKSRRSVSIDLGAERAKHSIRHNRTEDHIRHLESEVNRLKAALSSERKIRSLQLEAIRSLWSQLQRISSADSSNSALMTRSVPNGLPPDTETGNEESVTTMMSMSLSTALDVLPMAASAPPASQSSSCQENHSHRCSCSGEVQQLREVFTQEIGQLRGMIDQLSSSSRSSLSNLNNTSGNSVSTTSQKEEGGGESEKCPDPVGSNGSKQQKRPGSLNLTRASNPPEQELSRNSPDKNSLQEEKIVDYASQMASKLVDDAVEDKENSGTE